MTSIAKTDREMFFLMKYLLPLLLFVGSSALLFSGHPTFAVVAHRAPLQIPFILWGVFLMTLAEVKLADHHLEYRRFLKWQQVPYSQIRRPTNSVHPGIGCIALDRFLLPWGRIYFVALRPAFDHQVDLVTSINERRSTQQFIPAQSQGNVPHDTQTDTKKAVRLCLVMGLVGVLYSVLLTAWFPNFFSESNWDGFPPWLAFAVKALLRASSWPWALATGALLLVWIMAVRFRNRSWVLAMIVGSLLGHVAVEALR